MTTLTLRPARTTDVTEIRRLVQPYVDSGALIAKEAVDYFEAIQEFLVVEETDESGGNRRLLGCGALHILWEDLGEVRTLAASSEARGRGVGRMLVEALLERAQTIGVTRVFCLTFEVEFFRRMGFEVMTHQETIDPDVFAELLRSHDQGVAEFLDLARVKPNTLGNTRMIRFLTA
ncbi:MULTISPECIES: amino-acid N-acetyltransferase [Kocuria]|uniref:amino-acid N-acetyltransferase n=1 Tax=Kocuria TaxID=57493 RepID=UPI0006604DE4|nr:MULTISPECIES: amino-acid N-acetyltransferase [Kocuria]MCT1367670.1 amino-acid N-acetyltransferase [Rothia sp. p3-SID1597]RUQ21912.1 amino-acid N-acetyltransferase [Kocuria sp. HSID16901]